MTLFFVFIASCSETSSKQQIHKQIDNMQNAIEEKSLSTFMKYFTKDFIGNKRLSRNDLRSLIFYQLRRNRNINTFKWEANINVENEVANVEIVAVVIGSEKILPERGRVYTIKSQWKKTENGWMIFQANWRDVIVEN